MDPQEEMGKQDHRVYPDPLDQQEDQARMVTKEIWVRLAKRELKEPWE